MEDFLLENCANVRRVGSHYSFTWSPGVRGLVALTLSQGCSTDEAVLSGNAGSWVVSPNPQSDYAHKKGKLQREREHREGEWHKKMGMIPPR